MAHVYFIVGDGLGNGLPDTITNDAFLNFNALEVSWRI